MLVPSFPTPTSVSTATPRRISLFGSTGSIGKTALNVLRQSQEQRVVALFANSSVEEFVAQVREFNPAFAGLADPKANKQARAELSDAFRGQWLHTEEEFASFAASNEYDVHIGAVVGIEGIFTSLPAYASGKRVALANKEALVVGGMFFRELSQNENCGIILPVDSEHSSLFRLTQLLPREAIARIGLTASGGPFFRMSQEELRHVTVDDALAHPTWKMGRRISLDSATLMNKAFELIEAKWLFDVRPHDISVKIHPQSILHGFIECTDGSHFFHGSPPDMALPIAYALNYPADTYPSMPAFTEGTLELLPCDEERFPAIRLAREVSAAEEDAGTALRFYTANEVVASAFFEGRLPFNGIIPFIAHALEKGSLPSLRHPGELLLSLKEERCKLNEWLDDFSITHNGS